MENYNDVKLIMDMLKAFISGEDRTIAFAGKIEGALDRLFTDDEEIQDFITCFVSYRPGGGEYLYDEKTMVNQSKLLLAIFQSRYGT